MFKKNCVHTGEWEPIPYPLIHLKQKDRTGCGVAVIAMLCNVEYEEVKKLVPAEGGKYNWSMNEDDLRKLIANFHLVCPRGWTPCSQEELSQLDTHAIIATDTHWMVYDYKQKKILDPWFRDRSNEHQVDSVLKVYKESGEFNNYCKI